MSKKLSHMHMAPCCADTFACAGSSLSFSGFYHTLIIIAIIVDTVLSVSIFSFVLALPHLT